MQHSDTNSRITRESQLQPCGHCYARLVLRTLIVSRGKSLVFFFTASTNSAAATRVKRY